MAMFLRFREIGEMGLAKFNGSQVALPDFMKLTRKSSKGKQPRAT